MQMRADSFGLEVRAVAAGVSSNVILGASWPSLDQGGKGDGEQVNETV